MWTHPQILSQAVDNSGGGKCAYLGSMDLDKNAIIVAALGIVLGAMLAVRYHSWGMLALFVVLGIAGAWVVQAARKR